MPGRGRRIAVALIVLALLLSAGRWGTAFLAERWWQSSVADKVAQAGARRALQSLALELGLLLFATAWFLIHLTIAARIALPDRPPPEHDAAKVWPRELPRWSLGVLALVGGVLLGGGASGWLDELLLALDGVRFGLPASPLGADLGVFIRDVPLWLDLQHTATLLVAVALAAVVLLHLAGNTIRITERRVWISPRARGQLAILLALLALALGWGVALEPYQLAAGLRGPLLASEVLLHRSASRIEAAVALLAALLSLLWWFRVRGALVVVGWLVFLAALAIGRSRPLHSDVATSDPTWQAAARGLDSVAFQLAGLEVPIDTVRAPASAVVPTLWDDTVLALAAANSGLLSEPRRGWIPGPERVLPVWLAVRKSLGELPELLALSDDQVSPQGKPVVWRESHPIPASAVVPYRLLPAQSIRPLATESELATQGPGVRLDSWLKRLAIAWALQAPAAFSAPAGSRISWRLDPGMRLRAVAPFVHWSPPRARVMGAGLVWQSDGLLTSSLFPSSFRVDWNGGKVSMVRSTFLGIVDASSGEVRVFRREPADSLAAAWARIARPLIEPPSAIPAELRAREAYPEELLLAQALVLEGPAWRAGRLDRSPHGIVLLPPAAPGGSEYLVPFAQLADQKVGALLLARRTASGDSLHLLVLDSLWTVESSAKLEARWLRFPFQQALHDSVQASGDSLRLGRVRFALAAEGIVAYRPAWAVDTASHAQLLLVSVGLGRRNRAEEMSLGAGRTLPEAWLNFRNLMSPTAGGSTAQRILEQVRALLRHADSAAQRNDLQERERTLARLRELLELRRP
jgi:hypothetical protein